MYVLSIHTFCIHVCIYVNACLYCYVSQVTYRVIRIPKVLLRDKSPKAVKIKSKKTKKYCTLFLSQFQYWRQLQQLYRLFLRDQISKKVKIAVMVRSIQQKQYYHMWIKAVVPFLLLRPWPCIVVVIPEMIEWCMQP